MLCLSELRNALPGAKNVGIPDWTSTGEWSDRPDVSDAETKAEHLRRYSELWWSLDTSHRALAGE